MTELLYTPNRVHNVNSTTAGKRAVDVVTITLFCFFGYSLFSFTSKAGSKSKLLND
jgi:hypothetical protein